MKAAPDAAMALSMAMEGWPQHGEPKVPLLKPRWSRKCALTPSALTMSITFMIGPQYLQQHHR